MNKEPSSLDSKESRYPKMPSQMRSPADQLKQDKEEIKHLWEQKVRDRIRSAEGQTSIALLDSIEIFLDELIMALERSTLDSPSDIGKRGMSQVYGKQRAKFAGYYLPQLLMEFSLLREVILDVLHRANMLDHQGALIINSAIDSAISLAATEFIAVQQTTVTTALKKAEMSNRDLEHFAAVAAHDLKSPLATISGYLELLNDEIGERLDLEVREYIDVMRRSSERMRNLVDHLLDYARLAEMDKSFQPVDLNEVMKSVLQNIHETVQKTGATITSARLPLVNGDAQLLTQVFQNLIANSIKFHGNRTPVIQIAIDTRDEAFLFSLSDNGIGFDAKDKEDIFALYTKLRSQDEYEGAGIGLATCKKVIGLHGGRIWAESKPGIGSTFFFTLPNPSFFGDLSDH